MLTLVVVVMVVVCAWLAAQDADADGDHEQAGGEVQVGEEVLGQDVLGERERHEAEREDARRVGGGDDPAERDGVARPPAGADEVGGDHRLAVAGRERVDRAPAEGGDEQDDQQLIAGEDAGEAGVDVERRGAGSPTGCRARRSGRCADRWSDPRRRPR